MAGSEKLYRLRGELRNSKIWEDVYIGAVSEFAAYEYLNSIGFKVDAPDLSIHKKSKKSFSADFKSGDYNIHVKSQSAKSAKRYGLSWLFQKTDKLFSAPSATDLFLFCKAITEKDEVLEVEILGMVQVSKLVEARILKEPKVFQYKHSKIAIYFDDVKALLPEVAQ